MNSNDIKEVILTGEDIDKLTGSLAERINNDYKNQEVLLVGLLKGSVVFMSDILRKITLPCSIDFMTASSYGSSTVSSGKVNIKKDLSEDIKGRNVIIIEDIVDTGNTLGAVLKLLREREPKSLKLCSLLSKPDRRVDHSIVIDYLGVEIPDEFVVGYGLDYDEKYRNLPYIGILKEEVYISAEAK